MTSNDLVLPSVQPIQSNFMFYKINSLVGGGRTLILFKSCKDEGEHTTVCSQWAQMGKHSDGDVKVWCRKEWSGAGEKEGL